MRWKIYDEPVEMIERRFQFLPRLFRWQGRRYRVEAVLKCWTVARWRGARRIERRFFQVQCAEGSLELFQDLRTGTWHLRRARLSPAQALAVQRVSPAWR